MKRHNALKSLSREHHLTLSLAQKIIRAVEANDESAIPELATLVKDFDNDLKEHFQKEERGLFRVLSENYSEFQSVSQEYLDEHKLLLSYSRKVILSPSMENLAAYAVLLKAHTRKEERVLFPLVEQCFSEAELSSIAKEQ